MTALPWRGAHPMPHDPDGSAQPTPRDSRRDQNIAYPEIAGFRLIQEVGRSPMGLVYKARRLVEQDVVAIKLFRDETLDDPKFKDTLQRNAEASFLLEHPGLARCLGCVEEDGRLILVSEFAAGEPLSRALQRNVRFLPPRALAIALQAAQALAYGARRRRFHGRVHPGDLMIDGGRVMLLNLGLGETPRHCPWNVKDPHLFEPLVYTAPEAMPSRKFPTDDNARRAVDVYALGAVLYHMLTGAPPFRGSDEGTVNEERAAIMPAAVRWPRGSERSIPARALELVQRMLALDPLDRSDYEHVMTELEAALQEAEGRPAAPSQVAAPLPPLPPVEMPARERALPPTEPAHNAPDGASVPATQPVRSLHALASGTGSRRFRRSGTADQASSTMLIGAVVLVFGIALGVAITTLLKTGNGQTSPETAPSATHQPPSPAQVAAPPAGLTVPTVSNAAQNEAVQTLALIEEMLKNGEADWDRTTLRMVSDIARKVPAASRAGLKARLLTNKLEERIAHGGAAPDTSPAPAGMPAPTDAENDVFNELIARADDKARQQRYGEAVDLLKNLPPALNMAPFTDNAATHIATLQLQARAKFAEVLMAAEAAEKAGDFAKARGLYQSVQARFGMAELVETAAARAEGLLTKEEEARETQALAQAKARFAQEESAFAKLIKEVLTKAQAFDYAGAVGQLKTFEDTLTHPELKQRVADYRTLIENEHWLFDRLRQRLKDQIARDPEKASPLQVFSSRDKDAPGFDIIDFDATGITYTSTRGADKSARTRAWNSIHPRQPLVMLGILIEQADIERAQEYLAMSMLAFHRALYAEVMARSAQAQGVTTIQAQPGREVTPDELLEWAKTFRADTEESMRKAVQALDTARAKEQAQRKIMEQIARLAVRPDKK